MPKLRVRKSAFDPDSLAGSKQSPHKFGGGRDDEAFAPAAILRTLRPRLQGYSAQRGLRALPFRLSIMLNTTVPMPVLSSPSENERDLRRAEAAIQ